MNLRKPVFKNFTLIQKLVLNGIDDYLNNDMKVSGDRNGIFHGKNGINRAKKLKKYFEIKLSPIDTLALLLAIFGHPNAGLFGWVPGRSNRLSGLIADHLITGDWEHGPLRKKTETLDSSVFTAEALKNATREDSDTMRVVATGRNRSIFTYFDKTKGVRYLLNLALNKEYKQFANQIRNTAKKLSIQLTDHSHEIDLTFLTDIAGEDENAFTQGAVTGALKKGSLSYKIPEETTRLIGTFLSRQDAGRLAQTTQSALEGAHAEKKFVKS